MPCSTRSRAIACSVVARKARCRSYACSGARDGAVTTQSQCSTPGKDRLDAQLCEYLQWLLQEGIHVEWAGDLISGCQYLLQKRRQLSLRQCQFWGPWKTLMRMLSAYSRSSRGTRCLDLLIHSLPLADRCRHHSFFVVSSGRKASHSFADHILMSDERAHATVARTETVIKFTTRYPKFEHCQVSPHRSKWGNMLYHEVAAMT